MRLSVVIAAYDEEANIGLLYRRLDAALASLDGVQSEVVFVVEGTDGTREILEELTAGAEHVRVLYRETPSGLGAAFRRGFAAVADDSDVIVTMDADLNHRPEEIGDLLDALVASRADIVVGSRFVRGSRVDGTPVWKRLLSGAVNWAMSWFYGISVRDKSSGFRLYRHEALRQLAYRNDRFGFLPEILVRASRLGLQIVERPIHFTFREHGTSKMAFGATSWSYLQLFFSRSGALAREDGARSLAIPRHRGLLAVLLVAATLRLVGLGWSLPTDDYQHAPYHPDETWAMRNLSKLDPLRGRIGPGAGLIEGSLYYYLWWGAVQVPEWAGTFDTSWKRPPFGDSYGGAMYVGRLLNVSFELATTLLIYLALLAVSRRRWVAALGASIFAVFPFEIIYSHFVRTQTIANFFAAWILFLSLRSRAPKPSRSTLAWIGLVAGLATAARWTTAYVLVVPLAQVAGWAWSRWSQVPGTLWRRTWGLAQESCAIFLLPGFLLGVLVGNPMYVLAPKAVERHLTFQMKYADGEQFFSVASLFDIDRTWQTISYLIPYGSLPALWLLLYCGALVALFRRDRGRTVLPLVFFVVSYLFVISKAYAFDSFVREAMLSFPALAILAALGVQRAVEMADGRRLVQRALLTLAALAVVGSGLFSFDYVQAMARPDPREAARQYVLASPTVHGRTFVLFPSPKNYFIADPIFEDLPAETGIETRECRADLSDIDIGDLVVLSDFRSLDVRPWVGRARDRMLESAEFELIRTFDNTPLTLRWAQRVIGPAPHDMQYPFPVIYVFRRIPVDVLP